MAAPKGPAQVGSFVVAQDGASFSAQVAPGAPGHALTRMGAVPVSGNSIIVSPFGFDQGRRAKDLARQACEQARGRFQPRAVGRFAQGAWIFEGGCA
ncbi:hypothetical protein [Gemmobacter denitrificans]|uniref:Uncharacterized protein n=1 Tax=Gemmobacter denitrificans TaxID=3123040 RepID=A0ABU8BRF3_9RHOB